MISRVVLSHWSVGTQRLLTKLWLSFLSFPQSLSFVGSLATWVSITTPPLGLPECRLMSSELLCLIMPAFHPSLHACLLWALITSLHKRKILLLNLWKPCRSHSGSVLSNAIVPPPTLQNLSDKVSPCRHPDFCLIWYTKLVQEGARVLPLPSVPCGWNKHLYYVQIVLQYVSGIGTDSYFKVNVKAELTREVWPRHSESQWWLQLIHTLGSQLRDSL